jgi:S-adenosylmethionine:tRNA ribosyltransferase-isomerase
MIAAHQPIQRPRNAKLLVLDDSGRMRHCLRSGLVDLFRPGDLVIANDAATVPASFTGRHLPTGRFVEVRLAGWDSLSLDAMRMPKAIVFGEGDFQMRTEDRPQPPKLTVGDKLSLGSLCATVVEILGHPRFVRLAFDGSSEQVLEGIARHGRPIQYSHIKTPLALWDVWTPIAGLPVAFEPPSAGFTLDWQTLESMKNRGIEFTTITHAAGISSTGDPELDARLPFDEPYYIPRSATAAIRRAAGNGRIIAIGTTVLRALESAAGKDCGVREGEGIATQRLGPKTELRVVDALLTGTHEPSTTHYELLRSFIDEQKLLDMVQQLELHDYRTHEFGDSVFVEASRSRNCWTRLVAECGAYSRANHGAARSLCSV